MAASFCQNKWPASLEFYDRSLCFTAACGGFVAHTGTLAVANG